MSHLLNGWPKILWCDCSALWLCSELNLSNHSDYLCQIFTKAFVWYIILHRHWYKLTMTASMVISISQHLKHVLVVGLKQQKLLYEIHWYAQICIVLLNIVVCGRLCLVLVISDIVFGEYKACGLWHISNGLVRLCHYHCISDIYE